MESFLVGRSVDKAVSLLVGLGCRCMLCCGHSTYTHVVHTHTSHMSCLYVYVVFGSLFRCQWIVFVCLCLVLGRFFSRSLLCF